MKAESLQDEFKRLLLSLPVQPVPGREYWMRFTASTNGEFDCLAYVMGFIGHGHENYGVWFAANGDSRRLSLPEWKRLAANGDIKLYESNTEALSTIKLDESRH